MRMFSPACQYLLISWCFLYQFLTSETLAMRTVVFVSQKGGAGKSILAACIAVAAKEAGEHVFILDMDPKGSLLRWGARRNDPTLKVRAVPSAKLKAALRALARRKTSLVIVDTPAMESPIALAAIEAADLSLVPARPAIFDIWTSEVTGRRLKIMDKEFAFLLNQCPPARQTCRVQAALGALGPTGTILRPYVRAGTVFPDAAAEGKGVTELDSKGEAANEIRALWRAISRRLGPSGTNG
jgi:chromosome partitioning protein